MAGVTTPTINNWILDYYTYSAWHEFKNDKTLSTSTLDSAAGILGKTWEGDENKNDKKLFLTVLSRLKDGSDINMRYYEGCDDSPLEDLVPHFMNLVNLQEDEKLVKEGELLFKVIKCEAVNVCCRAGNFQKGKMVFDKLNLKKITDRPYVNMVKELESSLKNKNRETDLSYDDFVSTMMDYLELIADNFEEPIILLAAKKLLNKKSCRHKNIGTDTDTENRIPSREILDEIDKEDKNNNNKLTPRREKQQLRKLWDQNIKDMFGDESPTHENPTEESSDALFVNGRQASESSCNGGELSTPRKSSPKQNISAYFKVPARKAAANPSDSRTSTPKVGPSGAKSPFNRPSTSHERSSLSSPLSKVSPVQKLPTSDRSGAKSPDFQYRKNKGRPDRHEPEISSTRPAAPRDNYSVISDVSSVYGSKKRKWTEEEMNEFYDAVVTMGVGRWAQIKEYLDTTRTGVMLKDKWRNMLKSGDVERIQKKRQKKT